MICSSLFDDLLQNQWNGNCQPFQIFYVIRNGNRKGRIGTKWHTLSVNAKSFMSYSSIWSQFSFLSPCSIRCVIDSIIFARTVSTACLKFRLLPLEILTILHQKRFMLLYFAQFSLPMAENLKAWFFRAIRLIFARVSMWWSVLCRVSICTLIHYAAHFRFPWYLFHFLSDDLADNAIFIPACDCCSRTELLCWEQSVSFPSRFPTESCPEFLSQNWFENRFAWSNIIGI
jgi:hypothetical protein